MILCAGESLIDMVPDGAGQFRPLPGGAVYNTAVALGRLGVATGYVWPISTDAFGQQLLGPLAEAGVDSTLCPRPDRLTTLAFVTLDHGEARYAFYDEGSAGRMLSPADLPPLPATVTALFAGGISLVPEPCGTAIEALITQEATRLPVMLDPNIRPFFITDAPTFRNRLTRLLPLADIVKLSGDDLDWLFPGTDPATAAAKLLDRGSKIVLHTGGARGATAYWAGDPLTVPAIKTDVADTIGAGDTFNAGILASLHAQNVLSKTGLTTISADQITAALTLGARAAAVTVSRAGANPPWEHEL